MDNHKDSSKSVCEVSRMRGRIIFKLVLLCIPGLINLPGSTGLVVCFIKQEMCQPSAFSCTEGIISQISAKVYYDSNVRRKCTDVCVVNHSTSGTVSGIADHCYGASKCSITYDSGGSNGGVIDITFTCAVSTNTLNPTASPPTSSISDSNTKPLTEGTPSSTDPDITSSAQASTNILNPTASPPTPSIPDSNTKPSTKGTPSSTDPDVSSYGQASKNTLSPTVSPPPPSISGSNTTTSPKGPGDPYTAVIVVSVVVPIIVVVGVVAVSMNRRGQCNLLLGKYTKGYAKRSPNRTDTHAMSFTANANLYCDLNRDANANGCDYCQIATVGKETDLEQM